MQPACSPPVCLLPSVRSHLASCSSPQSERVNCTPFTVLVFTVVLNCCSYFSGMCVFTAEEHLRALLFIYKITAFALAESWSEQSLSRRSANSCVLVETVQSIYTWKYLKRILGEGRGTVWVIFNTFSIILSHLKKNLKGHFLRSFFFPPALLLVKEFCYGDQHELWFKDALKCYSS